MKFPFAVQSSNDPDNRAASSGRMINMYAEPVSPDAIYIKSHLGTEAFANTGRSFCRAMATIEGKLYVAQGGGLFRVDSDGSSTLIGDILDSEETTIAGNNGKVTVAAGGKYYVWNGSTINQPSAGAFNGFGSVAFFEQRTFLNEKGGRRVQWSEPVDPGTLGGLDFATAENQDDDTIRVAAFGSNLWVMNERTIESWAARGTGYQALKGATIGYGLKAFNLLAEVPNGLFFIGSENTAYITAGGQPQRVSNIAVESSIEQEDPKGCLYFEDEGHKFCAILFNDRPAWVYDMGMAMWSERAEGNDLGAWRAKAAASAYGSFFIGTDTGEILKLTRNNADASGELIRRIVSRTLENDGNSFTVPLVKLRAKTGFDDDPQVVLQTSGDGGLKWGVTRQQGLGVKGKTQKQIEFRALGRYEERFTMRLTVSDPADVTFMAEAFV